eukprot:Rhum_TRINITY_DN8278_c0_g1::Rhum_TRINITY_DN8278_c0_g1_i1::g.27030::m.27030
MLQADLLPANGGAEVPQADTAAVAAANAAEGSEEAADAAEGDDAGVAADPWVGDGDGDGDGGDVFHSEAVRRGLVQVTEETSEEAQARLGKLLLEVDSDPSAADAAADGCGSGDGAAADGAKPAAAAAPRWEAALMASDVRSHVLEVVRTLYGSAVAGGGGGGGGGDDADAAAAA